MMQDLAIIIMVVCALLLGGVFIGYKLGPDCPEYIFDAEYVFTVTEDFKEPITFTIPKNQCGVKIIIQKYGWEEDYSK